ncbi:hypothetical protein EON65_36050 [archaeon]|nr:MAG: hypothetical protein EON65_36050 [archaeon]
MAKDKKVNNGAVINEQIRHNLSSSSSRRVSQYSIEMLSSRQQLRRLIREVDRSSRRRVRLILTFTFPYIAPTHTSVSFS